MILPMICRGFQGLSSSFLLFLFLLFFQSDSGVEAQPGFISLDCGLPLRKGYKEGGTGIDYVPDGPYVDSGETKAVQANGLPRRYQTLRAFPEGIKNCYNLRPLDAGGKHLVRAEFFYGNYDGLRRPPEFEFHVGVHTKIAVSLPLNEAFIEEVIVVANDDTLWVCLVNTGKGTPVISTIELRQLPRASYSQANASQSLFVARRVNYGAAVLARYPIDRYDRLWLPFSWSFPMINTTMTVKSNLEDSFPVPSLVLQSAIAVPNVSNSITIQAVSGLPTDTVFIQLHYAELENLSRSNKMRVMDFSFLGEGRLSLTNFTPRFLLASHISVSEAVIGPTGIYNVTIRASNRSTLPPMINALESFIVNRAGNLPTNIVDVRAIEGIKTAYRIQRNWQGDPCLPKDYLWNGLQCAYYNNRQASRIISLNISSSGLKTEIPEAIFNLTALQTLDLSNNSIPITVSALLEKLPSLELLRLSGNQIQGVPTDLCWKLAGRNFPTRIEGLEAVCSSSAQPSPSPPRDKSESSSFRQGFHISGAAIAFLLVFI